MNDEQQFTRPKNSINDTMNFNRDTGTVKPQYQPRVFDMQNGPKPQKKSWLKRATTAIFGEDNGHSLGKSLMKDVLVPHIVDGVADAMHSGIESVCYGRPVQRGGYSRRTASPYKMEYSKKSSSSFSYGSSSSSRDSQVYNPRKNSVVDIQNLEFDPVVYDNRTGDRMGDGYTIASAVLEEIQRIHYHSNPDNPEGRWVSAQQVAELVRMEVPFNANSYGWSRLDKASVIAKPYGDGYILHLPGMEHR